MKITTEQLKNRNDFTDLLLQILDPLKPFYSAEKAELNIGVTSTHYENHSIPMEAFTRPLWGLVPFWAGGSEDGEFEEIYKKGLAAGTNPESKEYWGDFRDLDQKFVEMAGLAYGMLMAPDKVWEPLSKEEKNQLASWLDAGINYYECSNSNWQFFCILTNVALKSVGRPYSKERLELGLSRIDHFYVGDGWYTDGEAGQQDYYIGMAFHFYGLIYSMFMKDVDPVRCETFRERAKLFAKEFVYWFAEDGSGVPYGRSLTYRFAEVSFFSACILAGIDVYSLGVMKGIITRHLVYWMNLPIFDNAGILSIGYGYPNLLMSESYNGPGSPYWCMKAFAFLALPKEHDFWKAEALPLPKMEAIHTIEAAQMVMQRIRGQVNLYVPGRTLPHYQAHAEEKYSKFVYSTKYAFSVPRSQKTLREAAADSMLAFEIDGHIFVKAIIGEHRIEGNHIFVDWVPFRGITVKTEIIPEENGHLRRHQITSDYACMAYDCGFAVDIDDRKSSNCWEEGNQAVVENEKGTCKVTSVKGDGTGMVLEVDPNTNLLNSKTAIPMIKYAIPAGTVKIITQIEE